MLDTVNDFVCGQVASWSCVARTFSVVRVPDSRGFRFPQQLGFSKANHVQK